LLTGVAKEKTKKEQKEQEQKAGSAKSKQTPLYATKRQDAKIFVSLSFKRYLLATRIPTAQKMRVLLTTRLEATTQCTSVKS
jgi:hypothetical protein